MAGFDSTCAIRCANIGDNGPPQLHLKADNGAFRLDQVHQLDPPANQMLAPPIATIATHRTSTAQSTRPTQASVKVIDIGVQR